MCCGAWWFRISKGEKWRLRGEREREKERGTEREREREWESLCKVDRWSDAQKETLNNGTIVLLFCYRFSKVTWIQRQKNAHFRTS
jgi:hypothetical protein